MEALAEDLDDDSDSAENRLLKSEDSPCVCSKAWEKDFICGWAPCLAKKLSRSKPTKTHASFSNARKERKCSLTECGFVFRHYERTSRYIEQYRQNHSSAFLEKEAEWRPVMDVDVSDPYLPKLASSSQTFDRVKFIEAMSDYYKVAAMRSDLQNICLTGKRTDSVYRKMSSAINSRKLSKESLPFIVTSSKGKQVSQKPECRKQVISVEEERTEVGENREDRIRTALELTEENVLPSVPSKPDLPHYVPNEPVFLNSASCQSKEETKRFHKERIRLPKFQWTECHVKKLLKGTNITTAKVEKRDSKPVVENFNHTSDSDESLNRQLVSRGNLHLGSTIQSPKLKSKPARVAVGKCEVFSSAPPSTAERTRKSYHGGIKLPSEKAFIQILGQQTGPPPKTANQNGTKETSKRRPRTEEKTFVNQNLPLQYLTRFGRRNFHHVLEARSFKPGERKLGAAALANLHN